MAARDHVLGLPELVEIILGHLPMRDALLAQRVNKTWQAVIQLKPLQRKLFFQEPTDSVPLKFRHFRVDSPFPDMYYTDIVSEIHSFEDYNNQFYHPQGQALVQDAGLEYMWTEPDYIPTTDDADEDGTSGSDDTLFYDDTLFDDYPRPVPIYENPVLLELHAQLNDRVTPSQTLASLPEPWQRPEASWRKMLLTSPSTIDTKAVVMVIRNTNVIYRKWCRSRSQLPQRLGALFEEIMLGMNEEYRWGSWPMRKGNVMDGVRLEIKGREMWEMPEDEGWSRVKDGPRDVPLREKMMKKEMFACTYYYDHWGNRTF